ncbi:membrane fusion protein (multidrug efflux system) [Defluviimonas denitrificans]|uniref:Membrane fusion protein (Multidrug efflux system) n=1 Tax=Albidovulum denitrificans TaxID=404881 RepID=A0A2S8S515_9RHOB|nr:efflux RND transporter periplasmic adaptor subunit [Defluviimonas denitrificans]PQV55901.1 membrane fusion protein (multidrug efflux system) [Defluviimonas denitrificans]
MLRFAYILAAAILGTSVGAFAQGAGETPPQPVTVVTLGAEPVTLISPLPGRVAASGVAEVRPQVSGIITDRLFNEGAEVAQNDPLYKIDAASYEAKVAAAEAALSQAEATLRSAESEAKRQETLLGRSVVSQQNLDDAIAARDVADAAVKVARANLQSAQIDLDRTTIRAPLSGVVGLSETTQGALVTAGQATALTVIRDLDPVYVDVTQSAAELLRWRRANPDATRGMDPTVTLRLADGSDYGQKGHLEAAEPHVNELTGVIVLRLMFPNPDHLLLPGMYVQVEMPQGVVDNAILAPQQGIGRDRRGQPTALVVNADNVVEQRQLTVLRDQGANWIVTDGLAPGDKLIVEGLQKIAPGAKVTPEEKTDAPAAAPAAN